jgi:hypothetical protein
MLAGLMSLFRVQELGLEQKIGAKNTNNEFKSKRWFNGGDGGRVRDARTRDGGREGHVCCGCGKKGNHQAAALAGDAGSGELQLVSTEQVRWLDASVPGQTSQ